MKRLTCKCGSSKHRNTNNPECSLFTNKQRNKSTFCISCKSTTHLRKSSKLCPNNKVIKNYLFI